ncbi:unnamed protein product [Rotaria sp. Silwood1]|nr:unnamed protein product [Rotaria sp. Silwood1]CAF1060649.1 unnamed protein product [Rotaria sp. Silwood1]CAF3417357.1 unnamed protein product [Rotaria sp. Silwood1]CAF3456856.1 unnamed protein product [Rotaria sp. Silwood1]CAF5049206.1 unnamed protein product [Rotaria sp. Silwood1]
MILQHYPLLSAQLDNNEQVAFHDCSIQSIYSFNDITELINNENDHEKYFIEERQMKTLCVTITFIIPIVQLFLGFKYLAQIGDNPNQQCQAASDLSLFMCIGGVFALFVLGTTYVFLKIISSLNKYQSDVPTKTSKILVRLVSFTFVAITLIFFILIQIRVYAVYSKATQINSNSESNYCQLIVTRGALAMIILTYVNMFLFITIIVFMIVNIRNKLEETKQADTEALLDYIDGTF